VTILTAGLTAQSLSSLQTVAGTDAVGDGSAATAALINHIEGIACDGFGNIYIADADDHRIRKIATSGIITTVAGTGHGGFSGDGGPAISAWLNTPYGLAADRAGNLYIADLGNARIRKVGTDGIIKTIAGGGKRPGSAGDGQPATDIALKQPRNVAIDPSGNIYFSDFGDNRIYQITPAGTLLRIAGNGQAGSAGDNGPALDASLNSPAGLATDSLGAVYVADAGNGRVRKIYRGVITTYGSIPVTIPTGVALDTDGTLYVADSAGFVFRVTPALQMTTLTQPARDVALDAAGNLYVAHGSLVYKRPKFGNVAVFAGNGLAFHYSGDGGPALNARFYSPRAIARDSGGNLYVADTGNSLIRKISADLSVRTIAGLGTAGFSGDGKAAVNAQLNSPGGIAVDVAGNIYIADTGNQRIRRIDPNGVITTVAGTGTAQYSGDGAPGVLAALNTPSGLAVDSSANLYLADTGNHAVRKLGADGNISTVAGNGTHGFSGDGGSPASALLDSPSSVAVDRDGNLFVADAGNHRIRRISPDNSLGPATISTVPDPNAALWRTPAGIAVDAGGNLYVSDQDDQRVFRVESNGRVTTIAGTGSAGFSGEFGLPLETMLSGPQGLAVDASGNIYICDTGNNRIRKLTTSSGPPAASSATVLNAASLAPGSVAPGEIVSLMGNGIGPQQPLQADLSGGVAPLQLGGAQVLFNGIPAPLLYVGPNQINAQAPYGIAGVSTVQVETIAQGVTRAKTSATVNASAPAIFTIANGSGQAAALNEDGTLNSPSNPAARGSIVTLFATGDGVRTPPVGEGIPAPWPAPAPVLPVEVRIGDYVADLAYGQAAPGLIGVLQINARIPAGYVPAGALTVTLQVGSAISQPGVVVSIQ
jgi:uncharacterized protein (TIGR03437 family)